MGIWGRQKARRKGELSGASTRAGLKVAELSSSLGCLMHNIREEPSE